MRKGICIAGNLIVDHLYPVNGYPGIGELTTITEGISSSTGGAVCNVAMDLAALDTSLPVTALGLVGDDENGEYIVERLKKYKNINVSQIKKKGNTSFTSVFSDTVTKQRTFFHYRGANALLDETYFNWNAIGSEILHVGYMLLLDSLDEPDSVYGTKMARLLCNAQKQGIKTSVDVVTETGSRFKQIVPPALQYTDYCIINEMEAEQISGLSLRRGGALNESNMPAALKCLFSMGVSTWAVIHAPEGCYGLDSSGKFVQLKSLALPSEYIKGTVGAGDAFCAGVLYGASQKYSLREAMEMGIAAAACSLSEENSTDGMQSAAKARKLYLELKA